MHAKAFIVALPGLKLNDFEKANQDPITIITTFPNVIGAHKLLYFALINLHNCNRTIS